MSTTYPKKIIICYAYGHPVKGFGYGNHGHIVERPVTWDILKTWAATASDTTPDKVVILNVFEAPDWIYVGDLACAE